jgi:bis(5'-nucleosyl)-tetraphosphatase (symmetrical)
MATYAIGDVQGCYYELLALIEKIHFNPQQDILWFTGDLVNRGKHSYEVLKYIKNLGTRAITVLGNHDLHLLAVNSAAIKLKELDTFHDVLNAPDCAEICHWLQHQPLFHHDEKLHYSLVHAGLAPQWSLEDAKRLAREVEIILQSHKANDFFKNMYGDIPDHWHETLTGWPRLRVITNFMTRVRFCNKQGKLDLHYKGTIGKQPAGFHPWFDLKNRQTNHDAIIFGHWAALAGKSNDNTVIALDTGCCYGNCLTAFRLEDRQRFSVKCGTLKR